MTLLLDDLGLTGDATVWLVICGAVSLLFAVAFVVRRAVGSAPSAPRREPRRIDRSAESEDRMA